MSKQLFIRIKTDDQLEAVRGWMQETAEVPVLLLDHDLADLQEVMSRIHHKDMIGSSGLQGDSCHPAIPLLYLCLPDVGRQSRSGSIEKMITGLPQGTGLVARNLDELGLLMQMGYQGPLIGDAFLYAYNREALAFYLELFSSMQFILSDELTDRELEELTASMDPGRFIYKAYGYQPLMITNQCLSRNYTDCKEKKREFTDSKGGRFTAVSNCSQCSSTIYNGKCTSMLDRLEEIGYSNLLLDLTIEDKKEASQILRGQVTGEVTRGHHYKGID